MSGQGWHRAGRFLQAWAVVWALFIFGLAVFNLLHARWWLLVVNAVGLLFSGITWYFADKIIRNAREMARLFDG